MIRYTLYLLSESHFRIFLKTTPVVEVSKIEIHASFDKQEFKKAMDIDYDKDSVIYDIVVSKDDLRNIYDASIKLVFVDSLGKVVEESRPQFPYVNSSTTSKGVVKVIQNDFNVACRMNGSKAYFIKVKKEGGHCTACWDEDLRSSNNSNCKQCGGTGYAKFFFKPYKTKIGPLLNISGESRSTDDVGKITDNIKSRFNALSDFPLGTDDYMYSVKHGAVLRVTGTDFSEVQGIPVMQTISATEIPTEQHEAEEIHNLLVKHYGEFYAQ